MARDKKTGETNISVTVTDKKGVQSSKLIETVVVNGNVTTSDTDPRLGVMV